MNKLLMCAAACLLLVGTQTASADHRWDRGHSHNKHYDRGHGHRNHHVHQRDRVSVNLNIGRVVPDWRYRDYQRATSGLGVAYTTAWSAPPRNTVIVHQNTYINNEPRVVSRSTRSATSLLRDVNGRCYERSYDSRGNEVRIELSPSSCNF
jgi:hypothetical protein